MAWAFTLSPNDIRIRLAWPDKVMLVMAENMGTAPDELDRSGFIIEAGVVSKVNWLLLVNSKS